MQRITLNATEQAELEHTFKTTSDRRLRERCQAVLIASRGRKRKVIAQDLGVHRTTVSLWLKPYQQHGWAGLQIQWAPGQPGRIPEALASTLQTWVEEGPQRCGLDRAHWTYAKLASHLYRTTGIEVKRTAMRVFCQRHGIRPDRPTSHDLRGDPEKQRVARGLPFKAGQSGIGPVLWCDQAMLANWNWRMRCLHETLFVVQRVQIPSG
jgi:transposase